MGKYYTCEDGLAFHSGIGVRYASTIVGMMIMPIRWACLAVSIPMVSVAAIIFMLKLKETKGENLDETE